MLTDQPPLIRLPVFASPVSATGKDRAGDIVELRGNAFDQIRHRVYHFV